MYIPALYRNNNREEIMSFLNENNFGILLSAHSGLYPEATHIPFIAKDTNGKLELFSHMSRANPQWKGLKNGDPVLLIFMGNHTYISSSWYDHENVPTWNYIAVHIRGHLRFLNNEETRAHLSDLVNKHESGEVHPVSIEQMSDPFLKKEMKGLVAFAVESNEIFSAFKLSQNRDVKNIQAIIARLEERGDENSLAIASAIKKQRAYE